METLYLGGKFVGHDAAIFSIDPVGRSVFAISNERLTRYKHDDIYPIAAIGRMLVAQGIEREKVQRVCFANSFESQRSQRFDVLRFEAQVARRAFYGAKYLKDYQTADREFRALPESEQAARLRDHPAGIQLIALDQYAAAQKLEPEPLETTIARCLREIFPNAQLEIRFFDHQLCHAMSAWMSTPYRETLLLTFDGCGDGSFAKGFALRGGDLTPVGDCRSAWFDLQTDRSQYQDAMGSPGGVYHYVTYLMGFQPDADEGKVEALAAFGTPDPALLADLLSLFTLVEAESSLVLNGDRFVEVLNYPAISARMAELRREDFAATAQKFLEEMVVGYARMLLRQTGLRSLSLSGGVAANVIANLKLFEEVTDQLYIVPAMADDGTDQGAAVLQLAAAGYKLNDLEWLREYELPYFGPRYDRAQVLQRLQQLDAPIAIEDCGADWPERAAEFVANGEIGAIFHGRMEWGPRALGNRSIIADARRSEMRELINREIKRRPLFQPFCPSMLAEERERLFQKALLNKHMTCAFRMRPEYVEQLPSAAHIDGTARVQFVEPHDNPNYYRLLKRMQALTGFGVVINTSFNRHGRTIVETPEDAVADFLDTDLSFLMIEGFLVGVHLQGQ